MPKKREIAQMRKINSDTVIIFINRALTEELYQTLKELLQSREK